MDNFKEKFNRSSVFKKNDLDYSISRERLQGLTLINLAHIANPDQHSPTSEKNSYYKTMPSKNRHNGRFNTVEASQPFELISKPSLEKIVQDIPMDFSISLKNFRKIPLIKEESVKSEENDSDEVEDEGLNERKSLNEKGKKRLSDGRSGNEGESPAFEVIHDGEISFVDTVEEKRIGREIKGVDKEDKDKTSRRIRMIKTDRDEICSFGFFDALNQFMHIPPVQVDVKLWQESIFERCCCLKNKQKLSSEFQEICEKLIVFAYTGLNIKNVFHCNLILSVKKQLSHHFENGEDWISIGFSCNNPYEKDLKHNIAPFGLIAILFLIEFFPATLNSMIQYCLKNEFAFIPLAFDVFEITILALRKKKINDIMMLTQKCLESLCFFYAGCLAQWFVLHKENKLDFIKINQTLESQAMKYPSSFIDLAKDLLKFQS